MLRWYQRVIRADRDGLQIVRSRIRLSALRAIGAAHTIEHGLALLIDEAGE